ncbi:hypothetical protein [Sphingopyxis sp.]|jgi:hypothetical protein|uniref:hypothetical protein n=1 Tax=Sphingopyxis sp. TaxID=1908224 RepID=UPI003F72921A
MVPAIELYHCGTENWLWGEWPSSVDFILPIVRARPKGRVLIRRGFIVSSMAMAALTLHPDFIIIFGLPNNRE